MNKLFGAKKEAKKEPEINPNAPSLTDTSAKVSASINYSNPFNIARGKRKCYQCQS